MERKPRMIAVVGTNASGKSGLGIKLAAHFGGEVISADSRQVYRGLDLGSGKVTEEEMQGVRHHLLDVCEPGHFFSMADFQRLSYETIDDILARGKTPFLVGGTGLYVDAVCDGYVLSDIEPDLAYRRELEQLSTEALYAMLMQVMPFCFRKNTGNHKRDKCRDQKQKKYHLIRFRRIRHRSSGGNYFSCHITVKQPPDQKRADGTLVLLTASPFYSPQL